MASRNSLIQSINFGPLHNRLATLSTIFTTHSVDLETDEQLRNSAFAVACDLWLRVAEAVSRHAIEDRELRQHAGTVVLVLRAAQREENRLNNMGIGSGLEWRGPERFTDGLDKFEQLVRQRG